MGKSFRFIGTVLQWKGAHSVAVCFALCEGVNGRASEHTKEKTNGDDSEDSDAAHFSNDVLDHIQFFTGLFWGSTFAVAFVGRAWVSTGAGLSTGGSGLAGAVLMSVP